MPENADVIHPASKPESFYLLFLSEGFDQLEHNDFIQYCKYLTQALFEIYPYNYCKDKIGVWAHYTRSNQNGVKSVPSDNTTYSFFKTPDSKLLTAKPQKIIDVVKNLLVKPFQYPNTLKADYVWLNPSPKRCRTICVVSCNREKLRWTQTSFDGYDLFEPPNITRELWSLLPYIAVSMWPLLPKQEEEDEIPDLLDPYSATAAVLARELGIIFGLFYESELEGPNYQVYAGEEPKWPNLTSSSDVSSLKWRDHALPSRNLEIKAIAYPEVHTFEKFLEIYNESRSKIIQLSHPYSNTPNNDIYTPAPYKSVNDNHNPGPKAILYMDEPNMIEGGGNYRKMIFRPSVDCLMRIEGYNYGNNWITIPYCRICRRHICARLGGIMDYTPGMIRFIRTCANCIGIEVKSSISKAWKQFFNDDGFKEYSNPVDYSCVAASYRRMEKLFRDKLKYTKWGPPNGLNIDPTSRWGSKKVSYPINLIKGKYMHYYWNNSLYLQRDYGLTECAAMGAVGAVVVGGFGCLANSIYQDPNEPHVIYANSLTYDDFSWIAPGSVVNLKPNREIYEICVQYVYKLKTSQECKNAFPDLIEIGRHNNPKVPGHSLIFVKYENGEAIVADQVGINRSLESDWGDFEFILAAQWFDIENLPKPSKEELK